MATTTVSLTQVLVKGIAGGALAGLLVGAFVVILSKEYVIQREDFTYPLAFEQAKQRYASTVLLAFVAVFGAIGPFIAAASFGSWIRHAVYGLTGSFALVVGVTLCAAWTTNQQPFNMYKGSSSQWIDIARVYVLPAALIVGPVIGLVTGAFIRRLGKKTPANMPIPDNNSS